MYTNNHASTYSSFHAKGFNVLKVEHWSICLNTGFLKIRQDFPNQGVEGGGEGAGTVAAGGASGGGGGRQTCPNLQDYDYSVSFLTSHPIQSPQPFF